MNQQMTAAQAAADSALWEAVARGEVSVTCAGYTLHSIFSDLSLMFNVSPTHIVAFEPDAPFTVTRLRPPGQTDIAYNADGTLKLAYTERADGNLKWWYAFGVDELPQQMAVENTNGYSGPFDTASEAFSACLQEHDAFEESLKVERDAWKQRAEAAEVERDRLRAFVQEMVDAAPPKPKKQDYGDNWYEGKDYGEQLEAWRISQAAREALGEGE